MPSGPKGVHRDSMVPSRRWTKGRGLSKRPLPLEEGITGSEHYSIGLMGRKCVGSVWALPLPWEEWCGLTKTKARFSQE